uniref:Retrovirus-related Pol polyprotein from transposon TNT 1-94 n=1 Tax=Nicotiana tabacum TaxID=4097 RepID=A0A1S3ZU47_TOBAC|nr:PREDICTED: uncharacterized protein LOC107790491 [Nicotiana tabacum]
MTKDENTSRVINADNTTGINTIVQFNPASQLPIKLSGSHNFSTWKAQFSILMHDQLIQNALMASVDPTIASIVVAANKSKQSFSDELVTAGAPVTNSKLIVKILSGLGPEFREISVAILTHDTIVTYEELYEKFLDHELFLRHEEAKEM